MLTHPMQKRKKPETSVKSSQWCESTLAPMLYKQRARQYGGTRGQAVKDAQSLEDSKSTETKLRAQDGEEAVKVLHRPPNFRQQEDDNL